MNLQKIKEKYKQILAEPQPESPASDEQWEMAYSQMKNKRRKHILTESQCVNRSSSVSTKPISDQTTFLKVKEKLAQAIANLNKKDSQIQDLKNQNIKSKEQIKLLEIQIAQLKVSLQQSEQKIIDQKVAYTCVEKDIENIEKSMQSQKMDKELLQRQIQYYQQQIESLKKQIDQKDTRYLQAMKQIKGVDKYKSLSIRLKQDVGRLRQLLLQTQKYKVFASKSQYKHYIGKISKEHECWVGQDRFADVEGFLRKQQIGVGNKQFTNNLVRFLTKNIDHAKHSAQKRAKKHYNSKLKDNQRKINHSMNFIQIRQQQMKRSQLNNSLVKSRRNTLNESKRCTQSFIYDKLQKSLVAHEVNKNRQQCVELLNTFRKGVLQLIQQREVNKKKLIKLVDWIVDGIMSTYPKDRSNICGINGDFRLETEQIKIAL